MISNPNSIFYTCISKQTTILAEFNSQGNDLKTLATKCLEKTPPFHTTFSHTVRKKSHTFFVDDPFVYFTISDENLENSEVLSFLRTVKEAFDEIVNVQCLENLNSHCFQGEFSPIFHQLLSSPAELEGLDSPREKGIGSVPLLGFDASKLLMKKKKKKMKNVVDVDDECDVVLSRELSMSKQKNGFFLNESANQKAVRVWKRHVWVVLSVDLIVCSVLFGIWLWICRGFKCIDG